ncbi:MarR family transcriptional regulator [uncultured Microbacterium sp.]|uniref:MarR family winged helix-turn-helix transcriptional regulator n=1 Tax=uncultured Microbacterium sp. TaxID=191216 RepID=UPI00261ADAD6|nr:MarR family transcriptional regulator [uncultured Microbacterium sp.]
MSEESALPADPVRSASPAPDGLEVADLYDVDYSDPEHVLVQRDGIPVAEIRQINALMAALGELREAEEQLSEASRRYMRLGDTDMRALHYLIVCSHRGIIATPGGIAHHLRISSASTTKLLDRLERGGHVVRAPHPTDRRALAISITPATHRAAMETVGRQQSRRFYAAARLAPAERDVVIRFLRDMANEIAPNDEEWAQQPED